ncbi:hypothetical protein [Eilatimonas milleporae]|uniref:Uncharacterized protein n=1 Tax=Eilatimonas milleporae TaxID=911205 RepID=A0A3M0CWW2_9PROT|nr:hypothetical protein [Eilatimonas milleporae]RMB11929.1 hypothetical protein BXY39_0416 [Eilatimonas milleporae]
MPYETNPDGTQTWVPEGGRIDSAAARIGGIATPAGATPNTRWVMRAFSPEWGDVLTDRHHARTGRPWRYR